MATASIPSLGTSERAAFKRCVFRWNLEYRMGYRPKIIQADALWFGIGVHEALAKWYLKGKRRGPHPADTFEAWSESEIRYAKTHLTESFDAPVWEDAIDLGIRMLEAYVDYWGRDPQWQIIAVEQPFSIKINRGGKPVAIFRSRWDGVFRDLADGRIYLLETKTASQITLAYLEMDDQAGSYFAAAGHILRANGTLKSKEEIAGVQYNFLRKVRPDERPQNADGVYCNKPTKEHYIRGLTGIDGWTESELRRKKIDELDSIAAANFLVILGEPSQKQPPPAFVRPEPIERAPAEQKTQLEKIADEVAWMNAVREGSLPVIKTPTKDCPGCPFWIPCQLHERGKPAWKEIMKAEFRQSNPYANR